MYQQVLVFFFEKKEHIRAHFKVTVSFSAFLLPLEPTKKNKLVFGDLKEWLISS
jgi:hypothetical protein